jgi:hypothetical protein
MSSDHIPGEPLFVFVREMPISLLASAATATAGTPP